MYPLIPDKMKTSFKIFTLLFLFLFPVLQGQEIDLSGTWQFRIDSLDEGIPQKWYDHAFNETIQLPGSMATNNKGNEITLHTRWTGSIVDRSWFTDEKYKKYRQPGNIRVPFWLQPEKKYTGAAWYRKTVIIPPEWGQKKITLFLERCHWETRLWVDGQYAGMQNSLGAPHVYDLTSLLSPGEHQITLRVDNRIKEINPGINSHSITDHTQSNWNGITGKIVLTAQPLINISDVRIFPDLPGNRALVRMTVENPQETPAECLIHVSAVCRDSGNHVIHAPGPQQKKYLLQPGNNEIEIDYPMGRDMLLWDEFHPNVYEMEVRTESEYGTDKCQVTFGMRSFTADGTRFAVNGRPVFLRGTLDCASFPGTGFPPTGEEEWTRIFRVIKAHGLNHVRYHSWCPPEAAFAAADKAGVYLQVECSSWANQGSTIGDGKPLDQWLYDESNAIVKAYGNHPSFCMMAYGNEPAGKNLKRYLKKFVSYWKEKDPRRVYTSGAGWPVLDVNDYLSTAQPRIQHWGAGLKSIINARPPQTLFDWSTVISQWNKPVVSHEIGQWCVFPDFSEIDKYTGVLKAKNFEIFRDFLEQNQMGRLADSFLLASGKLQALCYKADIEAALRTPGFAGFQLLGLRDFPGQGTALVGVLNVFWKEKGYISPEEYSRFCNATVPLARLPKRVYLDTEVFSAGIEIAHFGEKPLQKVVPHWQVTDKNQQVLFAGDLPETDIPLGNGLKLGTVSFSLENVPAPEKLILTVSVAGHKNHWNFWVYPAQQEKIRGEKKVKIVSVLDPSTVKYLEKGGRVILSLKKGSLKAEYGGAIKAGFSSIFWNTAWTRHQPPYTLGILCDPSHPALADFPTDYHSDWQWWDAMSHAQPIVLDSFPVALQPIVRIIDDWFTSHRLALIMEMQVGKGRLLISGTDLLTGNRERPEARQLLYSLKKYAAGEQFRPAVKIETEELMKIFKPEMLP